MRLNARLGSLVGVAASLALVAGCSGGSGTVPAQGVSQSIAQRPSFSDYLKKNGTINNTVSAIPVTIFNNRPSQSYMLRRNITTMVFTSDYGNGLVDIFNYATGQQIGQIAGLNGPQGLATDINGNLFEADTNTQSINIYAPYSDSNPTNISETGINSGSYPVGIHVDKNLTMWVSNICSNGCSSPGNVEEFPYPYSTSTATSLSGGPSRAYFVTTDKAGNVWADGQDSSGNPVIGWWKGGKGSFIVSNIRMGFPGSIQFDGYGNLILNDQEGSPSGGARVTIVPGGSPPASRHITIQTDGDDIVSVALGTANARLFASHVGDGSGVAKVGYWPPSQIFGSLVPTTTGELIGTAVVQATLP